MEDSHDVVIEVFDQLLRKLSGRENNERFAKKAERFKAALKIKFCVCGHQERHHKLEESRRPPGLSSTIGLTSSLRCTRCGECPAFKFDRKYTRERLLELSERLFGGMKLGQERLPYKE